MHLVSFFILICSIYSYGNYTASWSSLDKRPLPRWYDEGKIGLLVYWGVYSVPSCCGPTPWFLSNWQSGNEEVIKYIKKNYPPGFTYKDFAAMFSAEFFDPDDWANLFKAVGAQYVLLSSKSQDGFAMFPSQVTTWNAANTGPKRDLVGDLSKAIKNQGLKFGIYYSMHEMTNTSLNDVDSDMKYKPHTHSSDKFMTEMTQLVRDYNPSVLWADHGDADPDYYNSTAFLAWLYTQSKVKDTVVVNDRWGMEVLCKHGDFYTCRDVPDDKEILRDHKWEASYNLDLVSAGYRRDMSIFHVVPLNRLLKWVVHSVSCGGNVLFHFGATKEGTIPMIFQTRLLELGKWLKVNGEAIYGSSPWRRQQDTINKHVWYTCTRSVFDGRNPTGIPGPKENVIAIYAIILKWPKNDKLRLRDITADFLNSYTQVEMLGNQDTKKIYLKCTVSGKNIIIRLPQRSNVRSSYAWTLKITSTRKGNL